MNIPRSYFLAARQRWVTATVTFLIGVSTVNAFQIGSTYDLVFNAFVVAPDGQQGLEGHLSDNLIIDGEEDLVPLNFAFPHDLPGHGLVSIESLSNDGNQHSLELLISSDMGPLVMNPLQEAPYGRVSISVAGLVCSNEASEVTRVRQVSLALLDEAGGEMHLSSVPAVSGQGTTLSPWRVSYSIPADEYDVETRAVRINFDTIVVPEPSTLLLFAWGLCGTLFFARTQSRPPGQATS